MELLFGLVIVTSLLGITLAKANGDLAKLERIPDDGIPIERQSRAVEENPDEKLKRSLEATISILKATQLRMEERVRSEGGSGISQVRRMQSGSRPYDNPHHSSNAVGGIHEHSNNIRTVGLGEFVAVLNGIEFRTRHNDYRLNMPHRTDKTYDAVEPIPFPEVPPEVTSKTDVNEQIEELREWFKAFANQDHSVRDYRKYFKPILCYMEGAWTKSSGKIDEPFFSDRHFIDAETWNDLLDKIEFTSSTGRKDRLENYSFLPTRVFGITNDSVPIQAQWNYRILCMPLKDDLPLSKIKPVEDIRHRMDRGRTFDELLNSRAARFEIEEASTRYTLLDELMYEIPGKDNQPGHLLDQAYHDKALHMLTSEPLNAAYYHRWNKESERGAMGLQVRARGFSDSHFFFALNSQEKIQDFDINLCTGKGEEKECDYFVQKGSYAIPLEIIYLTPLLDWNPYEIEYKGPFNEDAGKVVSAGGRNGKQSPEKAYNGTNSKLYYRTPCQFFSGGEVTSDPADTAEKGAIYVLNKHGDMTAVCASGTRIIYPSIPGVGPVRQRYPIFPVHGEDSPVWKELAALTDIVLYPVKYSHLLRERPPSSGGATTTVAGPTETTTPSNAPLVLLMGESTNDQVTRHTHNVEVSPEELVALKEGAQLDKTSSEAESHSHDIVLDHRYTARGIDKFVIMKCDGKNPSGQLVCFDAHAKVMTINRN